NVIPELKFNEQGSHLAHQPAMPPDRIRHGRRFPHTHRPVPACRGQPPTVRAERHAPDLVCVPLEGEQLLAPARLPRPLPPPPPPLPHLARPPAGRPDRTRHPLPPPAPPAARPPPARPPLPTLAPSRPSLPRPAADRPG